MYLHDIYLYLLQIKSHAHMCSLTYIHTHITFYLNLFKLTQYLHDYLPINNNIYIFFTLNDLFKIVIIAIYRFNYRNN